VVSSAVYAYVSSHGVSARKRADLLLARAGVPRIERRQMLNDIETGEAASVTDDGVRQLIQAMVG
jgi:hypothetical protein